MLDKFSKRYRGGAVRKVVIRRLPPEMDFQTFKKQVSPIPDHDYIYYVQGDGNYGKYSFSRAYINFVYEDDLFVFKEKFDDYVFLNQKGAEYRAVVEFAPFHRIPKERPFKKSDLKAGTIESSPYFQDFVRNLEKSKENQRIENFVNLNAKRDNNQMTPLLKYIKDKRRYKKGLKNNSSYVFVNSNVKKRYL